MYREIEKGKKLLKGVSSSLLTLWETVTQTSVFTVEMLPESHPSKRARSLWCLVIVNSPLSWVEGTCSLPGIQNKPHPLRPTVTE